jgi:hypothetical protein
MKMKQEKTENGMKNETKKLHKKLQKRFYQSFLATQDVSDINKASRNRN